MLKITPDQTARLAQDKADRLNAARRDWYLAQVAAAPAERRAAETARYASVCERAAAAGLDTDRAIREFLALDRLAAEEGEPAFETGRACAALLAGPGAADARMARVMRLDGRVPVVLALAAKAGGR